MAELDTNVSTETSVDAETETTETQTTETSESTEIAKLRAEMAKQKAALDKATKEAAESKRALRARQSAEEAAAEEAKETAEAQAKELAELRKRFAVAETSKKAMAFLGDEATATSVAEYLYGAEDIDAALMAIQKAWTAKEKALRLEFGKIPAPGVGSGDGVTITKEQLDAMDYLKRVEFATNHPDDYERLMGRK
ncbi:MAG: hypothetical protein J6P97_05190 [Bacteroidales bacterium]|nr:hypothetical protein [Bacteroidales bacterium]